MPTAATQPNGKRSKRGRLKEGWPSKRTPEVTAAIAESISLGLIDEEAAAIADITPWTLSMWRRVPEFSNALKKATAVRLRDRLRMIESRVDNRQSISWLVERQYYSRFAKPEVQIAINNSFNQTVNALSISISREEVREIEVQAEPIRDKIKGMFASYKPALKSSGDNGEDQRTTRVHAEPVKPEDLAPPRKITLGSGFSLPAALANGSKGSLLLIVDRLTRLRVEKNVGARLRHIPYAKESPFLQDRLKQHRSRLPRTRRP